MICLCVIFWTHPWLGYYVNFYFFRTLQQEHIIAVDEKILFLPDDKNILLLLYTEIHWYKIVYII